MRRLAFLSSAAVAGLIALNVPPGDEYFYPNPLASKGGYRRSKWFDKTYPALKASNGLKLIPYCLWNNRQPGNEMQVWFKQ